MGARVPGGLIPHCSLITYIQLTGNSRKMGREGHGKEREGGGRQERVVGDEYNKHTLYAYIKSHNETHYYVNLIFDNKIKNYS